MNDYDEKIKLAQKYIHAVYCIEQMREGGFFAIYGLEQQRIDVHEKLCDLLNVDRIKSKEICLNLDKYIGFDIAELENNFEYYSEKYAKKLITLLEKI